MAPISRHDLGERRLPLPRYPRRSSLSVLRRAQGRQRDHGKRGSCRCDLSILTIDSIVVAHRERRLTTGSNAQSPEHDYSGALGTTRGGSSTCTHRTAQPHTTGPEACVRPVPGCSGRPSRLPSIASGAWQRALACPARPRVGSTACWAARFLTERSLDLSPRPSPHGQAVHAIARSDANGLRFQA
jgi:hypothetical protein